MVIRHVSDDTEFDDTRLGDRAERGPAIATTRGPAVSGGPPAPRPAGADRPVPVVARLPDAGTLDAALALLGDSWTLLILQRAFLGVRRYAGWRADLGISDAVLAGRLRALTGAGILTTHPYRDGGRTRNEYRLGERGLDLWALLVAIWSWERRWVARVDPLPALRHVGCCAGGDSGTDVALVCGGCGQPVDARDTVTVVDPTTRRAGVRVPRLHPRRTRGPLGGGPLSWFPGTVEVLGDRWASYVLGGALLGIRSFSAFERELGISPDVLSDRLRRFVAHSILVAGPDGYRLTDRGRDTFAMFMVLAAWGDRWLGGPGRPSGLHVTHRACAAPLRPLLACTACGEPLGRRDVRFAPTGADRRG